jgi:signal transduction histidine kinase
VPRFQRLRRLANANSTRLVLLAFAVQLLLVAVAMASVYLNAAREVEDRDGALVTELRDDLLVVWKLGGADEVKALVEARAAGAGSNEVLVLADARGNAITGDLPGLPPGLTQAQGWQLLTLEAPGVASGRYRLLWTRLDTDHQLLVGRAVAGGEALLKAVWQALLASLGASVPAALMLALWLGRLTNMRLAAVAEVAEAVASGDLSQRAGRDDSHDAFDRLAEAINRMLDRIEALVTELRMVTDGLAHDLRSPLTRLRTRVEAAQAHPPDADTLEEMAAEVDRVLTMLTTALQISRAEAGIGRDHFRTTNLADLLETVAEIYGPLAEEQGLALTVDAPPGLAAALHQPLMQQALGNLVENALRHAGGARHIILSAGLGAAGVVLAVADDGPGIAAADHATALSRFGRLDPARGDGGMGLGLSLASAVAHLHNGDIRLVDNQPGLKVLLALPGGSAG